MDLLPADDAGQPVTGCACMDFWHDSAVQKRWLLRLTLFIGLLLVPVFVLAVFARPSADDYIYAARTHAVMQQYGFDLPRLLKAAWDTNVYYFENWQGLYVSGFLLAFTMSLDDFIITHFVKGPGFDTLSTKIYTEVKKGIKPEMYALSSLLFLAVLILLLLSNYRPKRRKKAD